MAKILFDIPVAHEPAEWMASHLVMELSPHIFSYVVVGAGKQLLQLRFYQLDANNQHELANELLKIISKDDLLRTATAKNTLLYNFPESQLVPASYFNADAGKDLVTLLHGDLNKGIMLSEQVGNQPQYNVFRVPEEVHQILQQSFLNGRYWHYYSVWMQCAQNEPGRPETYISVMFYPNHILTGVVKNKELHLLQSYAYEAAEDAAYYLLNICEQLQLSPENTDLFLSGMIDASSVLYTEISKYFGQAVLESFQPASNEPALGDYPPHFFSPLLKMAVCVS